MTMERVATVVSDSLTAAATRSARLKCGRETPFVESGGFALVLETAFAAFVWRARPFRNATTV